MADIEHAREVLAQGMKLTGIFGLDDPRLFMRAMDLRAALLKVDKAVRLLERRIERVAR